MQVLPEEIKKYLDVCKRASVSADKVIKSLSDQGWDSEVLELATAYYLPPTPISTKINQNENNDHEEPYHAPLITPGVNENK